MNGDPMTIMAECLRQLVVNQNNSSVQNSATSLYVKPDVSTTIQLFYGTEDAIKSSEWLEEFVRIAELRNWSDSDKLTIVGLKLAGSVRDWQRSTGSKCKTWNEWEAASKADLWRLMESRVQQRDESNEDYIRDKEKLCVKLGLNDKEIREEIIGSLRSRQLSHAMRDRKHESVNALIKEIREYEQFELLREQRFGRGTTKGAMMQPGVPNRTVVSQNKSAVEKPDIKYEKQRKFNFSDHNSHKGIKCYNCRLIGDHMAKDCPKPRREKHCAICGRDGHGTRECNEQIGKTVSTFCASKEILDANKPTKSFKSVMLDNVNVVAFLDTGAEVSVIKFTAVGRLGKETKVLTSNTSIRGLGGTVHPLGMVKVRLVVDEIVIPEVLMYVVSDNSYVGPEAVIGANVIDSPNIVLVRKNGKTILLDERVNQFLAGFNLYMDMGERVTLKCVNEVEIPPNTIHWIQVTTGDHCDNGPVIVETKELPSKSVLFMINEGQSFVPIINNSPKVLSVKRGQIIKRASRVDIVKSDESDFDKRKASDQRLISEEEIRVGDQVTAEEKTKLCALLNEYRDCFALNMSELGHVKSVKMKIEEIPGSKPVARRPYPTAFSERETLKKITDELMENGLIQESDSEYSSPVLLVKKKNGDYRMVIDYRHLNAQTRKMKFPMPKIDEILNQLSGHKLFCVLDAAHGFLQIEMEKESRHKAAFTTPNGHFEPTRMFFGLCNGPPVYQRMMSQAMGDLLWRIVMGFIDDLIVGGHEFSDVIEKLRLVFQKLRLAGITLQLQKCEFLKPTVEYLGFIVSHEGVRPSAHKLAAIREFPRPTTATEVRRFLGLTGFFRRFIAKYAEKASPMTKLLKKDIGFQWTSEAEASFKELRDKMTCEPILKLFDPEHETELHTDASARGLAGMLLQRDSSRKFCLVYCVSRRTTEVEANYHSSRLELMAVVWSVMRLRPLLLGIRFTIVTDCSAIQYLNTQKSVKPQVARWFEGLQEFNYVVKHRPGAKMQHIDALSRAPVEERDFTPPEEFEPMNPVEFVAQVNFVTTTDDKVLLIQSQDPELQKLIRVLLKPNQERSKLEKATVDGYKLKRGILYKVYEEGKQTRELYVLPRQMRKLIAVKSHEFGGHFAADKVIQKIRKQFWFRGMNNYIKQHIKQCVQCLYYKQPAGKIQGKLNCIPFGKIPFEIVHIDFLGPLVESPRHNTQILALVDNLTKFVKLQACTSTSTKQVLNFLQNFINTYGCPRRIISDRGTCFSSEGFQDFCKAMGIRHTLNSTQRPQANGQIERINRILIPAVASSCDWPTQRDWDKKLDEVQRAINSSPSKTTGQTPFRMLYGYEPEFKGLFPTELIPPLEDDYEPPQDVRNRAITTIENSQAKIKERYDVKHAKAITYCVGDVVVVRRFPVHTGESTKLQARYRGPLMISQVLTGDTYRIINLPYDVTRGRSYTSTAHASQLKLYKLAAEEDEIDLEDHESDEDDLNFENKDSKVDHINFSEDESEIYAEIDIQDRPQRMRRRPIRLDDYQI